MKSTSSNGYLSLGKTEYDSEHQIGRKRRTGRIYALKSMSRAPSDPLGLGLNPSPIFETSARLSRRSPSVSAAKQGYLHQGARAAGTFLGKQASTHLQDSLP